jgi:parvulin-like peptidyl-prolyl isomerase
MDKWLKVEDEDSGERKGVGEAGACSKTIKGEEEMRGRIILGLVAFIFLLPIPSFGERRTVDRIIAWVNDDVITQSELDREVLLVIRSFPEEFSGADRDKKIKELMAQKLAALIGRRLLIQEARRRNIDVSSAELEDTLKAVKEKMSDMIKGIPEEELRKGIKEEILVQKVVEAKRAELSAKVQVTDKEMEELYESLRKGEDPILVKEPGKVHIHHILVKEEGKAKEAVERIRKGEDFSKVAIEISGKEGDLGFISWDDLDPAIAEVVRKLKPKEVSDPIKGSEGYHVVMVDEVKEPVIAGFEEVKDLMRRVLIDQKIAPEFNKWLKDLHDKSKIRIVGTEQAPSSPK